MGSISFDEVKQIFLESIDDSSNINELIKNVANRIYQKGKNEALVTNVILCKYCKYGYQDEASLSLGTVRCSKLNCFKLENWYCGDGKPKED